MDSAEERLEAVDATAADWAPIALFIYKRPEHTSRMISSMQACAGFSQSPVYVFADGPKGPQEIPEVLAARAVARSLLGDRAIYRERESNLGLESSLIAGVSELCDLYGRAVVIEDDLVVAPSFLAFINGGLAKYERDAIVMQVCGYMYDVPELRHRQEGIFLPMTNSLGWGTWKRAWDQFDPEARGWRDNLRDGATQKRFDIDGHYRYFRMLSHHMATPTPAWDIRWYYTVFMNDGLVLFPPRTLVLHRGFDGTGTHDRFSLPVHQASLDTTAEFTLPDRVAESGDKRFVFDAVSKFRPATVSRKAIALAKYIVRRLARRDRSTAGPRGARPGGVGRDDWTSTGEDQ